jgi:hypothetical protein
VVDRRSEFLAYHNESMRIGDVDPSNALLRYVCDRFELSLEQRFWCGWLYAATYNGATAFYLYNEFPDAENVDIGRLQRWWLARGRDDAVFTTDRRWCRSRNQFVAAFDSYREWLGGATQQERFEALAGTGSPSERYERLFAAVRDIYTFGQFTSIIYLDVLDAITPLGLMPTDFDFDAAWSVRFGLYYAMGWDQSITDGYTPMRAEMVTPTQEAWAALKRRLGPETTIANVETTLCAYRKWYRGTRYIGYYLDRQALEIAQMAARVRAGVCWDVLWQYRSETYDASCLAERHVNSHDLLTPRGRAELYRLGHRRTRASLGVDELVLHS